MKTRREIRGRQPFMGVRVPRWSWTLVFMPTRSERMSEPRLRRSLLEPWGDSSEMPARVLGASGYRIVLAGPGAGGSFCQGRRISPGVTPELGCALFVEDLETGESNWFGDLASGAPESRARTPGRVEQSAELLDLTVRIQRLVVPGEPSELYVVRATSSRGTARRVRLTLARDIAFDEPDAFDSHPVFSKLFLQTERIETPPGLLLSRRPRSSVEHHPVLLFAPLVGSPQCSLTGGPDSWYETDRTRVLGRNLPYPGRKRVPTVHGTSGNVLDPMLALRIVARLDGTRETSCAFVLSVAEDATEARHRLSAWQTSGRVDRAIAEAEAAEGVLLARHGLSPREAAAFESWGAAVLAGDPAMSTGGRARGPVEPDEIERFADLGASPTKPFVLARLFEMSPAEQEELFRALRYWAELGLGIHAVLVHDGDRPDLPDSLSTSSCARSALSPRALEILGMLARLTLPHSPPSRPAGSSDGPATVLHWPRIAGTCQPPALPQAITVEFDNGFGGFTAEGTEYLIRLDAEEDGLRRPPRPWINVLANQRFGCLVSETGAGSTWYGNSREHRITPWRNDPVLDPHDEAYYLLDEESGRRASAFPGPIPEATSYEIRHGFGTTAVRHRSLGLEVESLVFVAEAAPFKVTRIRLRNPGSGRRRLSVSSYARLVLGPSTGASGRQVITEVDSSSRALLARNPLSTEFAGTVVFATAAVTGTVLAASFTGDRESLLGAERDASRPAGLIPGGRLDGRVGSGLDPCFAQKIDLQIEAGECCEVCFVLGAGENLAEAVRWASSFESDHAIEDELAKVRRSWRSLFSGLQVETPSRGLDLMVNGWLPYQTIACRIWGRSALYQSGGAFGFRDQLQDASSLLHLDPAMTREQILLHGSHQFVEGDVLHWWHPPGDLGLRTRFVDDLLWLPFLTASYVQFTGDQQILEKSLPLLAAPSLDAGEAERFLRPTPADRSVDLYEHCCLAIDRSLQRGPHGLPLFGSGDWNDGMNRVGIGGTGESVWMGFFLISVIDSFLPWVRARDEHDRTRRYEAHRADLVEALSTAGWDGEWYRRGYFDDGTPLGSKESDECRIDALAQAWAVLSGVAPPGRAIQAMDAAERELVSESEGIIRLLTPAFENSKHDPGYIKGYVAGVRENGGQYTHAALWLIRALAALGRRERVAPLLDMINPVHLASDPERVRRYQLEPYVVAADVYGVDPHVGRGGWSWYTGSSGWMSRVAIESLLGFVVSAGREARISPAVPDEWPGFTIRYRPKGPSRSTGRKGRRTSYEIRVENPDRCSEVVVSAECPELGATVRDGAAVFQLTDDGAEHVVRIRLGRGQT